MKRELTKTDNWGLVVFMSAKDTAKKIRAKIKEVEALCEQFEKDTEESQHPALQPTPHPKGITGADLLQRQNEQEEKKRKKNW